MLLNAIIFCCVCGVVPILLGSLYIKDTNQEASDSLISCYAQGIFTMWGSFQIIVIPLLLMKKSLTLLTIIWTIVIAILCLLAIVKGRNKIASLFKFKKTLKDYLPWAIIVAILLIAFQTYMLTVQMHTDADDAFYVASATTSLETDTIFSINPYTGGAYKRVPTRYALSPFYSFTAMLAKICKIHPAIVAHTLFPLFLIPLAYMVYSLLGRRYFKNKTKTVGVFLIAISVIQMFSAFSPLTTGVFNLTRIWQGKAILASILIPAIFYFSMLAFEPTASKKDWVKLMIIMFAGCMVSSMGIAFGAIALGMLALVASVREKNIKIIYYSLICCLPNALYSCIYLLMRAKII